MIRSALLRPLLAAAALVLLATAARPQDADTLATPEPPRRPRPAAGVPT